MLLQTIEALFRKYRLFCYQKLFAAVREKPGSLSATEAFSADIIHLLGSPTISQFADTIGISQPNATYKVNNLIKKGYLERENSTTDRREYHLKLSEKFYNYMALLSSYEQRVMDRIKARFPEEDVNKFDEMLQIISNELMPEFGK